MGLHKYTSMVCRSTQTGFTVLELMIVISIISILASIGIPSFQNISDRRQLISAAEQIYSHVQLARVTSISTMTPIEFHIDGSASSWQYGFGISDGTNSCNAATTTITDPDACKLLINDGDADIETVGDGSLDADDIVLKRFTSDDHGSITITTDARFSFDPVRGTLSGNPASISLSSREDYLLEVRIGRLGQARICSPAGSVVDYEEC